MIIKTLEQLKAADERTLHFAPWGLLIGGMLSPEDAARVHQESIERHNLSDAVPEEIHESFERLRLMHSYGVLCYALFTVVDDMAFMVLDQALGDRFIALYQGRISFVRHRDERTIEARRFDQVFDALHDDKQVRGMQLKLSSGRLMRFKGYFGDKLRWAREEGLLKGQRNRHLDPVLNRMRNRAAHPSSTHMVGPSESERAIADVAEIINHLWGTATPGGRLYPAPITREIIAIYWGAGITGRCRATPLQLNDSEPDCTYILVRAVEHDESLWEFDAAFERTTYPADYLWGPGSLEDAKAWLQEHAPQPDNVEWQDREFMVRSLGEKPDLPRRPTVAAGLVDEERDGTWFHIRADTPLDALNHVRHLEPDQPAALSQGFCRQCPVEVLSVGPWMETVERLGLNPEAVIPARVPSRWPQETAP